MKNFKMKLQEYKRKVTNAIRKLKRDFIVFKKRVKRKFIELVQRVEWKVGLGQRCAFCEESMFCEQYVGTRHNNKFFHVQRCHQVVSRR